MVKCPNCSGENAGTQRFCGECGTPLFADAQGTESYADSTRSALDSVARLKPGTLFAGRYQIIEELGMGGMGRIYRVLDTTLDREIALKLIKPEIASDDRTVGLLKNELVLARDIVHKNVAQMFDYDEAGGVPYITMQYVRGENLKSLLRQVSRLFAGQAIPIACQVCEGLAEAHRRHIVHRDLKPQNIMVDEDGQAKILDFGLARLLGSEGKKPWDVSGGTPAYISPEQARREEADGRSDIYSLGVLMYEMLTGTLPFKAESAQELIDKHLTEAAAEPRKLNRGISAELSQVVMKCLEKDPAKRYQSAEEVRAALDGLMGPRPENRLLRRLLAAAGAVAVLAAAVYFVAPVVVRDPWAHSLAVLPVEEIGTEERHQNLCGGLQDAITDRLSGIGRLRVLPVRTVNSHNLAGKTYPQIRKLLGVKDLLRLTLAVEGTAVRIKLYMIAGRKDSSPSPLTYAKDLGDFRLLQDEIARYIARTLDVKLAEERLNRIRRRGTDDIEAYNLFLDGSRILDERYAADYREEDFQAALGKLLRAVDLDPDYALAHWALGSAHELRYYSPWRAKDPLDLEQMYRFFEKASQLDPEFAETNLGLGWYHFNKGDNQRAAECFKKAFTLDPKNYEVNLEVGAFLRSIGLYRRAMDYLGRAAGIAPHVAAPLVQTAQCWMYLGRFDKAVRYSERAVSFAPNDAETCAMHSLALSLAGRAAAAEKEVAALKGLDPEYPRLRFVEALCAAAKGEKGRALELKGENPVITPPGTYFYLLLGMKDEALSNIEDGIANGLSDSGMCLYPYPSLAGNPGLRGLRGTPRFRDLVKRQKDHYFKALRKFEDL